MRVNEGFDRYFGWMPVLKADPTGCFKATVCAMGLALFSQFLWIEALEAAPGHGEAKGAETVLYGRDCRPYGWCFRVHRIQGLDIVESVVDSETVYKTVPSSTPGRNFETQCGETIPEGIDSSSALRCEDEPYFTTCGLIRMSCFEVYDQGSYTVIIGYGAPGVIIETLIGPPVEDEEDEDEDEDEQGK